uniref:Uncharacterized protein n=1 Tax=Anguilla anguilla TaxID=7936 RepID=A0A0E9R9T5_ANGAN
MLTCSPHLTQPSSPIQHPPIQLCSPTPLPSPF